MSIDASTTTYTVGKMTLAQPCCVPVPHLNIKALTIAYDGKTVLDDVSLDIYKGCITALIGPSGCGKTSFLSSLNRLLALTPQASVSGHIYFDGDDIVHDRIDTMRLRRRIGMIFQKPNPFPLSIRRNLTLPLREHGVRDRAVLNEKVERVLKDVGLWQEVKDRLDSSALALSGGQQQRLCIARALVLEPEILLMDEPCSALDPMASAVVEALIQRLQGRYTVVIVTHNLAQARRVANYAAFFWMKEQVGTLIEFGQCVHLFDHPRDPLTLAYVNGQAG